MKQYRKKPVVITAVQWTGKNIDQMVIFMGGSNFSIYEPDNSISIPTLEGDMKASINDFIIKGVQGEFYPCKPDIFNQTYDSVE